MVWDASGASATSPPIHNPIQLLVEGTEIDLNDAPPPPGAPGVPPPPVGMPHTPPGRGPGGSDDPRVLQLEWLQKACASRMRKDAEELQQLEAQLAAFRPSIAVREDSCDSCDDARDDARADEGPQSPVGAMLRFSQIALGTRGRMMSYRV